MKNIIYPVGSLLMAMLITTSLLGQEVHPKKEKIELKTGKVIEAVITSLKEDTIAIDSAETGQINLTFDELAPTTYYRLRLRVIEPTDAKAHWDLAEYCQQNKLYSNAQQEYTRAAELDESLKEQADQKINEVIKEYCESERDQAAALMGDGKYEEALKKLKELISKYPDSPYVEEAVSAAVFATKVIQNKAEEEATRKSLAERQKEQEKSAKDEAVLRNKFNETTKVLNEVKELNAEGLYIEVERANQADKKFKDAITKVQAVQKTIAEVLEQTKDVDLMSDCKEKMKESTGWQVTLYNNLGALWAQELDLRQAITWLNKTLAIDPENKTAAELKIKLIDIQIRQQTLPK